MKFSFLFVLLSLLLNAVITPFAQDKARSFIRSSDLDFFEGILKPKKFVDIIENLTIYFDKKDKNGELKNIFINDKSSIGESQTTIAKTGKFEMRGNKKLLILNDGRRIINVNGKISEFIFSKTDFNISNFSTKTTTQQKTQETSTIKLIQCSLIVNNLKKDIGNEIVNSIINCTPQNLVNIYSEIYTRLIKPFYIIFLVAISLLFVLISKNDPKFKSNKIKIYFLGFLSIVILESSSKFISNNMLQNLLISMLPFILIILIYIYFLSTLRLNKI